MLPFVLSICAHNNLIRRNFIINNKYIKMDLKIYSFMWYNALWLLWKKRNTKFLEKVTNLYHSFCNWTCSSAWHSDSWTHPSLYYFLQPNHSSFFFLFLIIRILLVFEFHHLHFDINIIQKYKIIMVCFTVFFSRL